MIPFCGRSFLLFFSFLYESRISCWILWEHPEMTYLYHTPKKSLPQTRTVPGPHEAIRWTYGEGGVNVRPMFGLPLSLVHLLWIISLIHLWLLTSFPFEWKRSVLCYLPKYLDKFLPMISYTAIYLFNYFPKILIQSSQYLPHHLVTFLFCWYFVSAFFVPSEPRFK